MRPLRKSFTWGEEMIVCQMVAVVGTDVMYKATHPVTSSPSTNLFLICELLVIGTLLVCCLFHHTYPSLQKRWSQVSANFKLALPWGLLGVYLLIYVIIVELTYRVNIIGTLFTFIFLQPAHTRPLLLFSLLLTAAIGAGIAFLLASHYPDLNSRRKYFHVLATTMFIPAVYVDPHLSALAFTVALCLFFLLELIRGYRLHPLGTPLHTAFGSFLDARDSGPVILAHIYLLGGCALPVFLACLSSNHSVSQYSGILLLGIGDTAASCIGQAYGSIYWPNRKTIEGTAAFVVGVFGGFMGVGFMSGGLSTSQVVVVFVSCLLSAILEAVTDQNDNLILPLFFWALLGGSN
ncbi:hypothetical protein DFS34DRAFT_305494 [Phlyctochytrium arcticum]|nr:hypothetical protein DFS34DRAFT_305494 [Phlyctochytrium arcticum]